MFSKNSTADKTVTWPTAGSLIKKGKIGIIPTDTLYGLVAHINKPKAIKKIYEIKNRPKNKPLIVLIGSLEQLKRLPLATKKIDYEILNTYWPGPVSLILPTTKILKPISSNKTLAIRLPRSSKLRKWLCLYGPVVAPSANPAGKEPARTLTETKKYFNQRVDFYVPAKKRLTKPPSALIDLTVSQLQILRPFS
ncbi:MAG: L-threonylcarbamoyladenylate synthase [Patescibacteria group bacterium]